MRTRTGHHRRADLRELTPRQRDVLAELATGKTNAEIAESLGIGFESVKTHVSEILGRLDVASRGESNQGVFSRLRRTATAFLSTGLGKVAVGFAATGIALVVAVALVLPGNEDAQSSEDQPNGASALQRNADGQVETYLLDDGREVNQALAEATSRWGFPIVKPSGDDFRLSSITYERPDPRFPTSTLRVLTHVRARGSQTYSVFQLWFELGQEGRLIDSGQSDITIRELTDSPSTFVAIGRERSFIVNGDREPADEAQAVALLLALFESAPAVLPAASLGPQRFDITPTQRPQPVEFVTEVVEGTDFVFDGSDDAKALTDASRLAGFEIVLPGALPDGLRLVRIRIPQAHDNLTLRPAYLSYLSSADESVMVTQYGVEIAPPGSPWSQVVDAGRMEVQAWRPVRLDSTGPFAVGLAVSDRGRTMASFSINGAGPSENELVAMLVAMLDAVPK